MAGILTELRVAGTLATRAVRRRLRGEIEASPDLNRATQAWQPLLATSAGSPIKAQRWVDLPATRPPWVASGISVTEGAEYSTFAFGRVYANRFLDIYLQPAQQLWFKLGEQGEIFRGTRSSHSFRASRSGELLLGNYFPNDWADARGSRQQPDSVYRSLSGGLRVLIIVWQGTALDGLRQLSREHEGSHLLHDELERIEQGDKTPSGWNYLWHLGPAEIYESYREEDGAACIRCRTRADVGILQRDVDLPLEAATEISWRWRMQRLPSALREDAVPSHDYLSIAVEFDNGRDLTYYWSSCLPKNTGFDCPLPNWKGKEFHVVARSGTDGLAAWQAERRNLYADYRHYIGTPPGRVVRVWLIANSVFQRAEGRCEYTDIVLHGSAGDVRAL
jgi:hypothetical protein